MSHSNQPGRFNKPTSRRPRFFPPATTASADGVVVIGGDLNVELLLDAYSHGIFPWPYSDDEPLIWASPDPRAVIELADFHPSRRVLRRLRSGQFIATIDQNFAGVMRGCAAGPGREGGTWITPNMIRAYSRLHRLGFAHCVEISQDGQLVGGVYGVAVGGLFAAESMFHRERDASTAALAALVAHLLARGFRLLDVQQWTPHTGRLGAREISRADFLERLHQVVDLPISFGKRLEGDPESLRGNDI